MFKAIITILIFAAIVSAIPQDPYQAALVNFIQMPGLAATNLGPNLLLVGRRITSPGECAIILESLRENVASWNGQTKECSVMKNNKDVGEVVQYRKGGSKVIAQYSLQLYSNSSPAIATDAKMEEYLNGCDIISEENQKFYCVSFTKDDNTTMLFRGINQPK